MIQKIFSVFDTKMALFDNPFLDIREESAIRRFSDSVNNNEPNNNWYKHPEDYSLYMLGTFNNETGDIDTIQPRNLVTASAMKAAKYIPSKNGEQLEMELK